eukprot:11227909-Lingulodinium_polyedra.AAC.1
MLHARTHCLCLNKQLHYPRRRRLTATHLHAHANAGGDPEPRVPHRIQWPVQAHEHHLFNGLPR